MPADAEPTNQPEKSTRHVAPSPAADAPPEFAAEPRGKSAARRRRPAETTVSDDHAPPPPAENVDLDESDVAEVSDEADELDADAAPEGYEVVEVPAEQTQLAAGPRSSNRQSVPSPEELRRQLSGHVCPFCGHRNVDGRKPCEECEMIDADATRSATVRRVGPWFVRRDGNPHAPGMKFTVLRELTKQGGLAPDSVVRGPTTRQMWTFAARIRGLAHLFGLCWNCNRRLNVPAAGEEPDDFCLYCGALIEPPGNPDQQLEVADTSESYGVLPGTTAGQTAKGRHKQLPEPKRPPRAERGTGRRQVSVRGELGQAAAHPGAARRVASTVAGDRPKPAAPRRTVAVPRTVESMDGGDALLSTGELATAFKLDRKTSGWSLVGRLPWGWIVGLLAAIGAAVTAWLLMGDSLGG